ncbi:hypothetical protein [Bacillus cihuensis]|uniref:hypothetical protein n=1 Tax=Bacillus cihuensis TaxID=1208599 RepID=UPI0004015A6F|nr:hypothetical protein [Bacillus cihuensis]
MKGIENPFPGAWLFNSYPSGYWEAIGRRDAEKFLQEVREKRECNNSKQGVHS